MNTFAPAAGARAEAGLDPDGPLKILLLSYRGNPFSGGQGIYIYYLARELQRMGHEVHVMGGQPYPILPPGVRFHDVPFYQLHAWPPDRLFSWVNLLEFGLTRGGMFMEMLSFSYRAFHALRRLQPYERFDVVHDNQCLGYGLLLMKRLGPPVVATIHHPLLLDRESNLRQQRRPHEQIRTLIWYPIVMQQIVARNMDRVITVSDFAAQEISQRMWVPRPQIEVVYNGVDTDNFYPRDVPKEPNRLVFVGRSWDLNKGFRYLAEALSLLRGKVDVHLTIVDRPGKYQSRMIQQYGIADMVTVTGRLPQDELPRALSGAAIAISPSVYEGFGLPAAEAMACGTPVIAAAGGALPEVVEHGVTGLVVPTRDSRALAAAIAELVGDPARRERMSRAARERVDRLFTWRRAAEGVAQVYRHEIARRGRAPVATGWRP